MDHGCALIEFFHHERLRGFFRGKNAGGGIVTQLGNHLPVILACRAFSGSSEVSFW